MKFVARQVNSNWFRDIFSKVDPELLPKDVKLDIVDYFLQLDYFEPIYKVVTSIYDVLFKIPVRSVEPAEFCRKDQFSS